MQLMIKCDKDPGNGPTVPSERQECLLRFIPRKLRDLYEVCERRDEAFLFIVHHCFPEPRDHSTTTDYNLFFLSIHPSVPLATCPVHSTLSCVQGCLTEAYISTGSSQRAWEHPAFWRPLFAWCGCPYTHGNIRGSQVGSGPAPGHRGRERWDRVFGTEAQCLPSAALLSGPPGSRTQGPFGSQQTEGGESLDTALDESLDPLIAAKMPEFIRQGSVGDIQGWEFKHFLVAIGNKEEE